MDRMTKKLERAYFNALKAAAKGRLVGGKVPRAERGVVINEAFANARIGLKMRKEAPLSQLAASVKIGKEPNVSAEADELLLYGDNDQLTYRQKQAVQKNLAKKLRDGLYSHSLAEKAWLYVADTASQRYKREIGVEGIELAQRGSGSHAYNIATRREAAAAWAWHFIHEAKSGDYDREDWAR